MCGALDEVSSNSLHYIGPRHLDDGHLFFERFHGSSPRYFESLQGQLISRSETQRQHLGDQTRLAIPYGLTRNLHQRADAKGVGEKGFLCPAQIIHGQAGFLRTEFGDEVRPHDPRKSAALNRRR